MTAPAPLPIDALLSEIRNAVDTHRVLVLEAPPGAGKTTRVPPALCGPSGQVLVSEPRRIAARLAAHRVAEERGEEPGRSIGYRVRFENVSGRETRVLYLTEGMLQVQLSDPNGLAGVHTIVLDEFHERNLDADVCLALIRARLPLDPKLRLVVMSATLDGERIASALGCPRIRSEGRSYPLEIEYDEKPDDRPLEKRVASAARSLLRTEPTKSILVFLPGSAEIRKAAAVLGPVASQFQVDVRPLHGEMPLDEQTRAVRRGAKPRIVLATNVAESSVTVDDIGAVIDSGLARLSRHSADTGRAELIVAPISQASADQRAGRAGRTGAGRAVRLYTKADLVRREKQGTPEISRADLSSSVLSLLELGYDPATLPWLDAPPERALANAHELLLQLGAVSSPGATTASPEDPPLELTALGRRISRVPIHPRLARVLASGAELGIAEHAALAVSLLSERDIRARPEQCDERGDSDVEEWMQRYREAEESRFSAQAVRAADLVMSRVRAVEKAYRQFVGTARRWNPGSHEEPADWEARLGRALLSGFGDRVARRSQPGGSQIVLRDGTRAELAKHSVVRDAEFLLALDTDERPGRGLLVRAACALDVNWLFQVFEDQIEMQDELVFDAKRERVNVVSRIRLGSVVLEESTSAARPSDAASDVLFRAARPRLATLFTASQTLDSLLARYRVVAETFPEANFPMVDVADTEPLLRAACRGKTTFEELRGANPEEQLQEALSVEQRNLLHQAAPESVRLPGGRSLPITYEPGRPPWIASRLQDFFGMTRSPTICSGRVPLALELLAPNQRPVQVTTDLASFWTRHYPTLRNALCRRYPKHSWPEDGATATPPEPRPPRPPPKKRR